MDENAKLLNEIEKLLYERFGIVDEICHNPLGIGEIIQCEDCAYTLRPTKKMREHAITYNVPTLIQTLKPQAIEILDDLIYRNGVQANTDRMKLILSPKIEQVDYFLCQVTGDPIRTSLEDYNFLGRIRRLNKNSERLIEVSDLITD